MAGKLLEPDHEGMSPYLLIIKESKWISKNKL